MNFLRRLDQRCPKSHLLSTHLSRRILILCFVAALSGAPVVSAQVVFDNFGPGNTFANGGATETGPSAAVSPGISTGFGFVPSLGGNLDSIVVAIGNVSGANDLHLFLSDGSGGTPGPVLETWVIHNLPHFAPSYLPTAVDSLTHPYLSAGTIYYLYEAEPVNEYNAWNLNLNFERGPRIDGQNGAPYSSGIGSQGAFRVTVTDVPEPHSFALLAAAVVFASTGALRSYSASRSSK